MHHVAIMNKSWKLIPKIVSGEKTIESRWYVSRRAPWGRVQVGDDIYFKNAGESIIARAKVVRVLQFEFRNRDEVVAVVEQYGERICLVNRDPNKWGRLPKYCILMFLEDAHYVDTPFQINKAGFGNAAAWLCVSDVNYIISVG